MSSKLSLEIRAFPCPSCGEIMYAIDEDGCEVYIGKCDNCNATYEIADYSGEGRVKIKKIKVS